jgi:hypothetical protein
LRFAGQRCGGSLKRSYGALGFTNVNGARALGGSMYRGSTPW